MADKRPTPARSIDTLLWMGVFALIGAFSYTFLESDAGARNVGIWISICGILLMAYLRYFDKSDR